MAVGHGPFIGVSMRDLPDTIYLAVYGNTLTIRGIATKVPSELPILVNATTSKIRVILFLQNPLRDEMSLGRFSKSLTFGFLKKVSTRPETQPAAIMGLRDVKGEAMIAVRTVSGWPSAIVAPRPARMAFARIHHLSMWMPVEAPEVKKPRITRPTIRAGMPHFRKPDNLPLGGIWSSMSVSTGFSQYL